MDCYAFTTVWLKYLKNYEQISSFDFSTFVITGPSTSSVSVGLALAGEFNPGGIAVADATQCLTDTFSITNQVSVPVICGTNTGYHGKLGLNRTQYISFLTGQDQTPKLASPLGLTSPANIFPTDTKPYQNG